MIKSALESDDVVITHHWMFQMRGGEKVLQEFCKMFPRAVVGCLAFDSRGLSKEINQHSIQGSCLQRFRLARKYYKELLPLHPLAISSMRVAQKAKLVIASDASMIKGMPVSADAKLVCYCHSPPRYIWEMPEAYTNKNSGMGWIARAIFRLAISLCKRFDRQAAKRVDLFIANSRFVASRIEKYYCAPSIVVHPPVACEQFDFGCPRKEFFLVVSELVPYKRVDLAVDAFNESGLPLVIIGDGPERKRLEALAGANIQFLGRQPFSVLRDHYQSCRAFIFPGLEDFGITPLEAQAAGAPVVAFGSGGALETVVDGKTGIFFDSQAADCLNQAIADLNVLAESKEDTLAETCRRNAEGFGVDRFREEIVAAIASLIESDDCFKAHRLPVEALAEKRLDQAEIAST